MPHHEAGYTSAPDPAVQSLPKKSLASTGASIHVPPYDFDQIAATAAKDKQVARIRVLTKNRLSQR